MWLVPETQLVRFGQSGEYARATFAMYLLFQSRHGKPTSFSEAVAALLCCRAARLTAPRGLEQSVASLTEQPVFADCLLFDKPAGNKRKGKDTKSSLKFYYTQLPSET